MHFEQLIIAKCLAQVLANYLQTILSFCAVCVMRILANAMISRSRWLESGNVYIRYCRLLWYDFSWQNPI